MPAYTEIRFLISRMTRNATSIAARFSTVSYELGKMRFGRLFRPAN